MNFVAVIALMFLVGVSLGAYRTARTIHSASYKEIEALKYVGLAPSPDRRDYRLHYQCPVLNEYWTYDIRKDKLIPTSDREVIERFDQYPTVLERFPLDYEEWEILAFAVTGLKFPDLYRLVVSPKLKPSGRAKISRIAAGVAGVFSGYLVGQFLVLQFAPTCDTPGIRKALSEEGTWRAIARRILSIELYDGFKHRMEMLERAEQHGLSADQSEVLHENFKHVLDAVNADIGGYVDGITDIADLYQLLGPSNISCSSISFPPAYLACSLNCNVGEGDNVCPIDLLFHGAQIAKALDWSYHEIGWIIYPPWLGSPRERHLEVRSRLESEGYCYTDRRGRMRAVFRARKDDENAIQCTHSVVDLELNRQKEIHEKRCNGSENLQGYTLLHCNESKGRIAALSEWGDRFEN